MKLNLLVLITTGLVFIQFQTKAQSSAWSSPPSVNSLKNPVPSDPVSVKAGKKLYEANCTPCHGNKGKGDGIAAASLSPKPADHTSAAVQKESDGALFWKLSEGHNPMPSYKTSLSETDRWSLVNYIRTLAAKPKG